MSRTLLFGQKSKQLSTVVFSLRIISSMIIIRIRRGGATVLNAFQLKGMHVSLKKVESTDIV